MQLVDTRFGPPLIDSLLNELAMLRRTDTVDKFCSRFMALSCHDHSLTETQQIQLFTTGLGEPLHTDVALQRPASLDEVVMFARAYEPRSTAPTGPPHNSSSRSSSEALSAAAAAPPTSMVASSVPTLSNKPSTRRKLSPTEIADRRIKGLCFHCDDKFSQGHMED
jgi:hypothetical protein